MRLIFGSLLMTLVWGCTELRQSETIDNVPSDTVYDGNIISREKMKLKRPTIQLDNGFGESPKFSIGDTSVLRIRIPRFTEYDMILRQIVGATIIESDTAHNRFLIVPEDNKFSFVLNQYYPKGKVVRYTRNWSELRMDYDEKIVELTGLIEIGKLSFKAD